MDFPSPLDFDLLVSTASVRQYWRALGESIRVTDGRQRGLGGSRRSGRAAHRAHEQAAAGSRGVAKGGAADVVKVVK